MGLTHGKTHKIRERYFAVTIELAATWACKKHGHQIEVEFLKEKLI
jgi:hypothetical protein